MSASHSPLPLVPPIYFTYCNSKDHFVDTGAILISIVLKEIMGCSGGTLILHVITPEHPVIAI